MPGSYFSVMDPTEETSTYKTSIRAQQKTSRTLLFYLSVSD